MRTEHVVGSILLWWLGLLLLGFGFSASFPFTPTFPYATDWLTQFGPRWLTTWAHFDGVHYLTIITQGYEGTGLIQAFFPLYPLMVRLFSFGVANPVVVGVLLSFSSLAGSLLLVHRLWPKVAQKTLWLWLAFPTAFFFLALYTESFFLFLTLASYYCARRKLWAAAAIFGIGAGMTRLPGFLVGILLAAEARHQKKIRWWIWLLIPGLGLLAYMAYLGITFGDPLLFVSVQQSFGANRSAGLLIPILTPMVRYARMLITVPLLSPTYFTVVSELASTLFGTFLTWKLWQRKEYSFALYAGLSLLLPTLTGTLSSMPRYVLTIFPLFLVAAKIIKGKVFYLLLVGFVILQVINLLLFTQGKWVS